MIISAMKFIAAEIPDALLVLAGNGPMKEELEQLIISNNLEHHVKMIGYCTVLEKYQKITSVLAACSYREGLPLNLVEAMLVGNPVVASHNRGHDELVRHGETGFLVAPDDIGAMADCITRLLRDDTLRNRFGMQARKDALKYSSDNVKIELKEVYGL